MPYPYPPLNIDPLAYEGGQQQPPMGQPPMGQAQDAQLQQEQQNPEMQQMTNNNITDMQQQGMDDENAKGFNRGGPVQRYRRGGWLKKKIKQVSHGVKKVGGPMAGAVLGNMIAPGIGGLIGGGLGGSLGPRDRRMGPLGGALMGQMGLAGLNMAGAGASGAGLPGLGGMLSKAGGQNYISSLLAGSFPGAASLTGPAASTPSFLTPWGAAAGDMSGARVGLNAVGQIMTKAEAASLLETAAAASATGNQSFLAQLMTPQNLLSAAGLLMSHKSRVSPEEQYKAQANAQLQYEDARDERKKKMLNEIYDKYRIEAPEIVLPDYSQEQGYREGGQVLPGRYLDGWTKGKADKVPATIDNHTPALLSDGEYVIPADVVSAVGDWNNKAGAAMFDRMVKRIRKHKGIPTKTPNAKNPLTYMMGA